MKKNTSIIITVITILTLAIVSLVQVFALDIQFNDEPEQSTIKVEIEEIDEITTAPVTTQVIDEVEEETQAEVTQETQEDEITTARVITDTYEEETTEESTEITTVPVSRFVDETEEELLENGLTQDEQDQVDEVLARLNEEGFGNELTNDAIEDWLVYSIVVLKDEDTQTDDTSIDFSDINLSQFASSEGEATISGPDSWVFICETVQDVFGEAFFDDVAYAVSGQWALDWFHGLF